MRPIPFDPIIAEAYQRAALDGRDMFAFAGQMERMKTTLAPEDNCYKQWGRLNDLVGETLWAKQDAQSVLLLRQVFLDTLEAHFVQEIVLPGESAEQTWLRWRAALSEASFYWQVEAMEGLCNATAINEILGEKLGQYRDFLRYFRDRRWVETRAVFEDLATDTAFPEEERGYHLYVCGQIDLYFHYEFEQAKEEFAGAEKLLAGKPLAFHGWIEYYLKSVEKDPERAAEYVEKALKLDANHAPSLIQKADLLAEKGLLAEAENFYLLARQLRPGNPTAYTRLIDLYGKPDLFEQKAGEMETVISIDTQLDPATSYLTWNDAGSILQQLGEAQWPKAEAYLLKASALYPPGITPRLNLGYFYLDTGKKEQAADYFQQVVRQAPDAREGYLALARLYEAQENWEEARLNYEQVRSIIPSWERFMLSAVGRCLRKLERWDEAENALLQAWALDAHDDSGAMTEIYELVEQYYKHPDTPQPDRAVQLLDRAAQKHSGTTAIAAGMANRQGHALFYVGRYAEALAYYEKAATLIPEEPVYYTNQADCYDKLYREAREESYFQNALSLFDKSAALKPQDSSIPKKRRQLSLVRYNPHLAELPDLYQVHIEVGQPLLQQITLDYKSLLPEITALTDALRTRMQGRHAINLPGLRYRDISESDGVYQFRLYETPVLRGQLPLGQAPTMAAVLEQFESFISRYCLDLFINYWDVDQEVPLLSNSELVHFTRVLMAMMAEQTPLPALPELHQYYRNLDGPRLPVAEAVEKLRLTEGIRPNLYGSELTFVYHALGEREEQQLLSCLVGQGNNRALAIPLDTAQAFLGAVVRLVENPAGSELALVTRHEALRPFLRSMLAGLPQVAILKSVELPADSGSRMAEPLTIQEQDAQALMQALQQNFTPRSPDKNSG